MRDFDGELHEVWSGEDPNSTCLAVIRADFEPAFTVLDESASTGTPPDFNPRAFVDLDNDGWADVVGSGVYSYGQHNEGHGRFHYRAQRLPVPDGFVTNGGPVGGDYDNDGDADIF